MTVAVVCLAPESAAVRIVSDVRWNSLSLSLKGESPRRLMPKFAKGQQIQNTRRESDSTNAQYPAPRTFESDHR
jgi:hypothetical protein